MTPNLVVVVSVVAGVCHISAFLLKNLSRYQVQLLIYGCEQLSVVIIRV